MGYRANGHFRKVLYRRQSHHGKNIMRAMMTTAVLFVFAFTSEARADSIFPSNLGAVFLTTTQMKLSAFRIVPAPPGILSRSPTKETWLRSALPKPV
jgi:hypothetical protein